MTASSLERTYSLPLGYRVTSYCDAARSFEARWSPDVPKIRKQRQRDKFLEAYQAVRRVFLQEVAATIGGNVLVVDTDRCMTCETILAPAKH